MLCVICVYDIFHICKMRYVYDINDMCERTSITTSMFTRTCFRTFMYMKCLMHGTYIYVCIYAYMYTYIYVCFVSDS